LDQFADRKILRDNTELIIDRIKTSANADQGLFGGMETFIALKKTTPSTLMERLMMEQEVFKAFISGNPLDGLYKYIKKFSFLSVVKEKADVGNFIIVGYIKEIQRAKKKGFFVKVEDISDSFEFFTSDPCGLEKFDMVIIHGYKNKTTNRIQISKIIKTTHDTLKGLAGSTYDSTETVVKVKKARYGDQRQAEVEKIKAESIIPSIEKSKEASVPRSVNTEASEEGETEVLEEPTLEEAILEEAVIEEVPLAEGLTENAEAEPLIDDGETAPCDCEKSEAVFDTPRVVSSGLSTQESAENPDSSLLEYAKELLNETVGRSLPLTITAQQLKTIGDVQEVVQLIKDNPGERRAIVLDKEVQVSDYAIEVLKKYVEL
jgi:hypothetical protein